MMMICAVFKLFESQYGGLLCGRNFMLEQFRICFCYGGSVGFLPDWVFQNYVAHGVPSAPTNPTDGQHALQRFRRKNSLTFSCSTPAESAVKGCALMSASVHSQISC